MYINLYDNVYINLTCDKFVYEHTNIHSPKNTLKNYIYKWINKVGFLIFYYSVSKVAHIDFVSRAPSCVSDNTPLKIPRGSTFIRVTMS